MARPSIVPIALTLDDRTGYTLWAPPWEEDGEEWQAFLGSTVAGVARVHLFPSPTALAAFCRSATDHDLADHPVWPVVVGLGADDLTPDEDHRFDLDGVYDIAAEDPDRWAVDELAATLDIVGRLAECCDVDEDDDDDEDEDEDEDEDDGGFESLAELMSRPEPGLLGLGVEAFLGRAGEEAWVRLGAALDDLWEDVVEELAEHLDWTGAARVELADYPSAADEAEGRRPGDEDDDLEEVDLDEDEDEDEDEDDGADDDRSPVRPAAAGATVRVTGGTAPVPAPGASADRPGTSGISGAGRLRATPADVRAAAEFWEAVGILPVEVVVPEGAGLTLRCYVEDEARFLGRDGEVFLFATPGELTRFCGGDEAHDLTEVASWAEVAVSEVPPLPADQDRYDLTELSELLAEVADGAAGLLTLGALLQPVEGVRDLAEYGRVGRVEQLLAASTPLGRSIARAEREPRAQIAAADAAVLAPAWDEVVTEVSSAIVFRD